MESFDLIGFIEVGVLLEPTEERLSLLFLSNDEEELLLELRELLEFLLISTEEVLPDSCETFRFSFDVLIAALPDSLADLLLRSFLFSLL